MGMDEDVATTVLSVFTGLVIGTVAESVMPSANAGASAGELMFETAVQAAILVVMFRALVNFGDLSASGGIPFGMALAAAQRMLPNRPHSQRHRMQVKSVWELVHTKQSLM